MRLISTRTAMVALVVAIFATTATVAAAHTIGPGGGRVYETSDLCVTNYVQLSHGSGGGQVDSSIESDHWGLSVFGLGVNCVKSYSKPAGYILGRTVYYYWGAYANQWQVCQDTGWFGNQSDASYMSWQRNYGVHAPCGDGYYSPSWAGYVWNNGAWNGGWVGTGYHYFTYWN